MTLTPLPSLPHKGGGSPIESVEMPPLAHHSPSPLVGEGWGGG